MLHSISPAASFTAATTAPALSALDLLDFAGRHMLGVALAAAVPVLLLFVWSLRRDAQQHRSITTAYTAWRSTGDPQGWPTGWAWSGFKADPEDEDQAEDAEELPPAAACDSCHLHAATVTVSVAGGPTFHLCTGCSPVATVLGRAS